MTFQRENIVNVEFLVNILNGYKFIIVNIIRLKCSSNRMITSVTIIRYNKEGNYIFWNTYN